MRKFAVLATLIAMSLGLSACHKAAQFEKAFVFLNVFESLSYTCAAEAIEGQKVRNLLNPTYRDQLTLFQSTMRTEAQNKYNALKFEGEFTPAVMGAWTDQARANGGSLALDVGMTRYANDSEMAADLGRQCNERLKPLIPEMARIVYGDALTPEELDRINNSPDFR